MRAVAPDDLVIDRLPAERIRTPRSMLARLAGAATAPKTRRILGLSFLLLIVALFALPSSFGMGVTGDHSVPRAPVGLAAAAAPLTHSKAPLATPGPSTALLPGSNPKDLSPSNSVALSSQLLAQQALHPVNWSKLALEMRTGTLPTGLPAPAPAAPHPAAGYSCVTGSVVGTVRNATGVALQGVSVQAYSATGAASCPLQDIPPVTTNLSGGFTVKGPVGADYLTFTIGWYLQNLTYVEVYPSVTTYLNYTVFMVKDAVAYGYVYGNTSKHPAESGVSVAAVARDQSQICEPGASTQSNGKFQIALCPLPSTISFTPAYGFLSTFRYANATPGESVNLGNIYLEPEPAVKATLYDASTGKPIPSGECDAFNPTQCNAIKVCSSATNVCLNQGPALGTATVAALAPRGYDYIEADSTGYITNDVSIGWVNGSIPTVIINMLPLGTVGLSVQVTHNSTSFPGNWHTGMWTVTACSMSGYRAGTVIVNPATFTVNVSYSTCTGTCGGISPAFQTFPATPLRVDINIAPDTTGVCGNGIPQWPIPGDLPVWGNETYLNVTPNAVTDSYLNLTPGNYVYGNVTVQPGSTGALGGFTALITSQDNPTLQAYGYNSQLSPWMCSPYPQIASGKNIIGFCAPAPPGPGKILISSLTLNYSENFTWGSTPYMCCYHPIEPMTLNRYSGGPVEGIGPASVGQTSINLTGVGTVHGRVFQGNSQVPVFFGSVKISAAGDNPQAPGFDGAVYLNGSFYTQAPLGWVSIQASASGFAPNTIWAYVNGSTYVGNISLTPLATLQGRLIDPTGHGIYEADVKYCKVDAPNACTTLGAGLSSTDGGFNGTLLGGWLPWTTYEVQVTAAGFTQDWSWVNTTAGRTTVLPPITLYPIGTNSTASATRAGTHPASLSSTAAGVWIDGTLLDPAHDFGIQSGGIQACPVDGSLCTLIPDGSNSQGYFNGSVAPGLYNLTVSSQGFYPVSVFFNASQASYLHLGMITMTELPWVVGTAVISPYGEVSVLDLQTHKMVQIPMAPGATAFSCNGASTVCGTALQISTQGTFFVQTGGGVYNKVQVTPNGGSVGPSINGGFGSNTSVFNVTGPVNNLTLNVSLPIYSILGGYVYDNSTVSPSGRVPWLPARWTPVTIATFGPSHASNAWKTNGGGFYEFFVPAGPSQIVAQSGVSPESTIPKNESVNLTHPLNNSIPGAVVLLPQLNLTHFGWLVFRITNEISGGPAAFVGVSATTNDPLNGTLSSTGVSNAFGFVNMTAPPGSPVLVQIAATQDFNATQFNVSVNSSRTSWVNGTTLYNLGATDLQPFGWVRSLDLNNTSVPDLPTIIDKTNGLPLPLATITVTSPMAGLSGSSLDSNWMGQYISDAPPGPADTLLVNHWAYLPNSSLVNVAPNAVVVTPTINMSGVGILAGVVLKYPGLTPIPFASVQTCPANSTGFSECFSTTTNASGVFWVASYPSLVSVTVTANGFVSNTTTIAKSCSDCWNWIPAVILNEFSYVFGTVRALPSGLPLSGATVAACSPLGNPVGLCGFEVASDAVTGQFLLAVPAGSYILQANATGFNATTLPIYLVPGEVLPVGILFLKQFGTVVGTVISAATLLPVENASVYGCPLWSGGQCTPTAATNIAGQFSVSGPPGPYTIAVSANGYADSYSAGTLVSGVSQNLAPILITPLGLNVFYRVSGQVVNASDPSMGIAGAVVSADVNGTPAFSARTDANGGFALTVLYGAYVLTVVDPGYLPAQLPVTVHQNLAGLLVTLQVMTFSISGSVTDGLTHDSLTGVTIAESSTVLAVSDANGAYAFQLANGTHNLVATYEGGGSVNYAPVNFQAVVNGVSVVHDLALVPQSVTVTGVVVDAIAGTALPGAVVTLRGTTVDGVPVQQTVTADLTGGFSTTLYLGSYNASATYSGYNGATVGFSVTPAGQKVPIPLKPQSTSTPSTLAPSGTNAQWVLMGALGVVVVSLGVLALLVLRRRAPPPSAGRAPARRPPSSAKAPATGASAPKK